jgi:ammonium transporter Rh
MSVVKSADIEVALDYTAPGAAAASHAHKESAANRKFAKFVGIFQVLLIIVYGLATEYSSAVNDLAGKNTIQEYYGFYQDVHVMIFVGFGFLMTFGKKMGFSAVGYNFMIATLVIQFAMLMNGFWHSVHTGKWHILHFDVVELIKGDFAAGAVLITFGGLLGKVNAFQLLWIAVLEITVYGFNEMIGALKFEAVDMGGSIFVHSFGAYFGLACCWALRRHGGGNMDKRTAVKDHPKNGSGKTSDMFAMIGTLFLWMFWPSFNGALAVGAQQHRVVVNTVLSLCGSCMGAFMMSAWLRDHCKFDMVDIQNATLAGGVAVGSSADLVIQPWGAVLVGTLAGCLSVYGYVVISPWMEGKFGLYDTCGIHNLHGMPGLMGGIGGAIAAGTAGMTAYNQGIGEIFPARASIADGGSNRTASEQALMQLAALGVCFLTATIGGVITGTIVSQPWFEPVDSPFEDEDNWEVFEDPEVDRIQELEAQVQALSAAVKRMQ